MKFEITEAQLRAIINCADNMNSMIGTVDENFNNSVKKDVRLIDRMLKKNGFKRIYK